MTRTSAEDAAKLEDREPSRAEPGADEAARHDGSDPARQRPGSVTPPVSRPAIPEIELTRMNAPDRPAASRVRVQPASTSSGVRKMPPPVPLSPASRPIPAPAAMPGRNGTPGREASASAERCGGGEPPRSDEQHKRHERPVEPPREIDDAPDERGRHGPDRRGDELPPREGSRPVEADDDDAGDEEVEDERRRPHDHRRDADEGHRGEVRGRAGMADRGIEDGGGEEEQPEQQRVGQHRHRGGRLELARGLDEQPAERAGDGREGVDRVRQHVDRDLGADARGRTRGSSRSPPGRP